MPEVKISVSSTAVPLMAKSTNITAEVVAYSVLSNSSLPGCIINESIGGMSSKATLVYKYAMDRYTLGLPNCLMGGLAQASPTTVQSIIEAEIGQSITLVYALIDEVSDKMLVMPFLSNSRGYHPQTNDVTTYPFVLEHPNDEPVLVSKVVISSDRTTATITYTHKYTVYVSDGEYFAKETFEETIPVDSNLASGGSYCIAFYYLPSGSSAFWYYNMADGTYPDLHVQYDGFGVDAFMPVIPLRHQNVDLTTIDDDLYRTSKALLRKLGLNITSLAESINSNPDIAEIDHAYVMFGVPANTEDIPSLRYLTEYFHYLYTLQKYAEIDGASSVIDGQSVPRTVVKTGNYYSPLNTPPDITLQEHGLDIEISFNNIYSSVVSGVIGKRGFASSSINITTEIIEIDVGDGGDGGGDTELVEIDASSITYRYQLTSSTYREVTVHGLLHSNNIYKSHLVETSLSTTQEEGNNNLIIPIHYGIAETLQVFHRNELYNNSLTLICNSYVVTKLKWYESTWFRVVVMVVGIVIFVYYYDPEFLIGWMAIFELLATIAAAIVINYAFKFVVKHVGAEWGAVLAIVAVIASMFIRMGSFTMPTAQMCLQATMSILEFVTKAIGYAASEVYAELTDFYADAKDKLKELAAAQDLLEMENHYDPLNFTRKPTYTVVPIESPDAFFNRTIHSGNVGTVILDVISNYHEIMLKLPEREYV
jgi:hypothetical protein